MKELEGFCEDSLHVRVKHRKNKLREKLEIIHQLDTFFKSQLTNKNPILISKLM